MQITPINFYSTKKTNYKQQETSFKGGRFDVIKYAILPKKGRSPYSIVSYLHENLNIDRELLAKYAKPLNRHKAKIIMKLAKKFNIERNIGRIENTSAIQKKIENIYDSIKFPKKTHLDLIENPVYTFEQLETLFAATKNDSKKLALIENVLRTYAERTVESVPFDTLKSFLDSSKAKEINKNFKSYKPFIQLHSKEKGLVASLEKEIESGKYNELFQETKLQIADTLNRYDLFKNINPQQILANSSESRLSVLDRLGKAYEYNSKEYTGELIKKSDIFMDIYNTTNESNLKIRNAILKSVKRNLDYSNKSELASIETVKELFTVIDQNPQAKAFVKNAIESKYTSKNPLEMLNIVKNSI